jgi:hypothetical protein
MFTRRRFQDAKKAPAFWRKRLGLPRHHFSRDAGERLLCADAGGSRKYLK